MNLYRMVTLAEIAYEISLETDPQFMENSSEVRSHCDSGNFRKARKLIGKQYQDQTGTKMRKLKALYSAHDAILEGEKIYTDLYTSPGVDEDKLHTTNYEDRRGGL